MIKFTHKFVWKWRYEIIERNGKEKTKKTYTYAVKYDGELPLKGKLQLQIPFLNHRRVEMSSGCYRDTRLGVIYEWQMIDTGKMRQIYR